MDNLKFLNLINLLNFDFKKHKYLLSCVLWAGPVLFETAVRPHNEGSNDRIFLQGLAAGPLLQYCHLDR